MKKVLILVCSSHEPPYDGFMKAQKETWDSIEVNGVRTVFYHGSGDNTWDGNTFRSDCPHGYFTQHWKHKQAIDACWHMDWDIVFRTHSSSYVDKRALFNICQNLPTEKLYGGWLLAEELPIMTWSGQNIKQSFIAGPGVFYDREIADVLRNNIPKWQNIEEDVLSGRILQCLGYDVSYVNRERVDMPTMAHYREGWHYRIKTTSRENDIQTMRQLHERILSLNKSDPDVQDPQRHYLSEDVSVEIENLTYWQALVYADSGRMIRPGKRKSWYRADLNDLNAFTKDEKMAKTWQASIVFNVIQKKTS